MPEIQAAAVMVLLAGLVIVYDRNKEQIKQLLYDIDEDLGDKAGIKSLLAILCTAILLAVLMWFGFKNPAAAVLIFMVTILFFRRYRYLKDKKKKHQIDQQIEIALNIIEALYVTTNDLIRAFEQTAECVRQPLAGELMRTVLEANAGKPISQAMEDFAGRMKNRDIDVFVQGIVLSEKYGTNTTEIIHDVSEIIRDRITLFEEIRNEMRGQGFTIGIFLASIPILITLIMLFWPDGRDIITGSILGKAMINVSIVLEYISWYLSSNREAIGEL